MSELALVTLTQIQRATGIYERDRVERFLTREGLRPRGKVGAARVWDRSIIDRCRKALCPGDHATVPEGGGA